MIGIALYPLELERPTIKSEVMIYHRPSDTWFGCSGSIGFAGKNFVLTYVSYVLCTNFVMPGQ